MSISQDSLYYPVDIVYNDVAEEYYVSNWADTYNGYILKLDDEGQIIESFFDNLDFPSGLCLIGNVLYVVNNMDMYGGSLPSFLIGIDLNSGTEIINTQISTEGTYLDLMTTDNNGNIYIGDSEKDKIYKYDINNDAVTDFVEFSFPIIITASFYVGAILPTTTGDTLVILSNTDGDTNPGIAWEQWENGDWYAISNISAWGLNISQAIFPIVNYGELPLMADFSVASTNIQTGETITFTDESTGNPTSWEWSFEGGEPATSVEQNPQITYNGEGTFDVSLVVSTETDSDTLAVSDFISVGWSNITIDTLNYPLNGTYAVYVTNQNGFVSGNNEFGDIAKANYFSNNQEYYITGMLIDFAYTTGGNPDIEIAVWDDDGGTGPGNKLGNVSISLNTITSNIINQELSYVSFNTPINVPSSFYAGFMLPTTIGDTLVVWSNMDGETTPGIAWEQWDIGDWYPINSPDSWGLDIALAIFPVIQNTLDIGENHINNSFNIFPNPSNGIYYFSLHEFSDKQGFVEVFNTNGICIYKNNIASPSEINSFDLSNHAAGLYFVRLEYNNEVYFQKIIKK